MVDLGWTEGSGQVESGPIRCVGCSRKFADDDAFEAHIDGHSCGSLEYMGKRLELPPGYRSGQKMAIWRLRCP